MSTQARPLYEFGPFRVDPEARLLLRGREPVPLTPKAFDTLLLLVERSGRLVSKDELMHALWPDTFVCESNLSQTIFMLRKALGETGSEQRFIVTVPGRGYRFAAAVREATVPAPAHEPALAAPPALQSAGKKSRWWILFTAAAVALGGLGMYLLWPHSPAPRNPVGGRVMLAVLPFENLTGDAGEDYFSDGLTEEMITQLGRQDPQHLGVIARTSVTHYKDSRKPLKDVGRELGVQYVLEGSVRRSSSKVRVAVQLTRTSDQATIWTQAYDRELKDLLSLQTELAQEIADEVRLPLGQTRPRAPSPQPPLSPQQLEAYDLYLKGEYFLSKRTISDFQRAIAYFQQATVKDPKYARAWAGEADCYALLGGYSGVPQAEFMAKARAAALRALEIDDRLPEAHTALALIVQNYDWDWQTAEKEFRRAIELDPNYATAHHWYAEHLMWRGRFDEALQESERARQLDPLSLIIAADNGAILYFSRQYDRAIAQFRTVLDMDPNFSRAQLILSAYAQKGMFAQALAVNERQGEKVRGPWYWSTLAYLHGRAGHQAEARDALRRLQQLNGRQLVDPSTFVAAYLGLGDKEQALAWLEKAYEQHSNAMAGLKVDPAYDPLRGDPRFQDLLQRVGLAR